MSAKDPIRHRLTALLVSVLGLAAVGTYLVLNYVQNRVIEQQAVTLAESVARLATVARSVYAEKIADKLAREGSGPHIDYEQRKRYVPLPSQFLKEVGHAASRDSEELYRYRPLSKWNIEPNQGLQDEFQKWAWRELEAQDQDRPHAPIHWQPVWRFEEVGATRSLRYMRADPASSNSCVQCHNAYERTDVIKAQRAASGIPSGKQWVQHQLLGSIEVVIPLNKVETMAVAQTRQITTLIVAALLLVVFAGVWFMIRDSNRLRRILLLSWQATHDPLTGLVNRRGFEDALDELLLSAKTQGKSHALCYLDLDHFKKVNDKYGHAAGDGLIKQLAGVLSEKVRINDTVARLGGDEFAVLLAGCNIEQASEIAENLRHAVEQSEYKWGNQIIQIGASVGIVLIKPEFNTTGEVMRAADAACYTAKKNGRNRIVAQ